MKRRQFTAMLLGAAALTLTRPVLGQELAPGLSEETFKNLDAMVENIVKSYNSNSWKPFFKDYARAMSALATEQTFNALYTNNFKKSFGDIKSRKLNTSRTSFPAENGVLIYDVTCSKKNGILAVNWMKEGGQWKVQQVQLQ